jgi:hypothetical protein
VPTASQARRLHDLSLATAARSPNPPALGDSPQGWTARAHSGRAPRSAVEQTEPACSAARDANRLTRMQGSGRVREWWFGRVRWWCFWVFAVWPLAAVTTTRVRTLLLEERVRSAVAEAPVWSQARARPEKRGHSQGTVPAVAAPRDKAAPQGKAAFRDKAAPLQKAATHRRPVPEAARVARRTTEAREVRPAAKHACRAPAPRLGLAMGRFKMVAVAR